MPYHDGNGLGLSVNHSMQFAKNARALIESEAFRQGGINASLSDIFGECCLTEEC